MTSTPDQQTHAPMHADMQTQADTHTHMHMHKQAQAQTQRIVTAAAALFHGGFAQRFARAKLKRDPLFATLLRTGAIPDASCLIDLGCGQGLLAAWLHAARSMWSTSTMTNIDGSTSAAHDAWPIDWPAAPRVNTYLGIDRSRFDIRRARAALPPFARVFRGDVSTLGTTLLDRCDVVTLLDVLHYLKPAAQDRLIGAIATGLPPWGVLVMRVGDGGSALASAWSHLVDGVIGALRGHPPWRLHRRSIAGWTALLEGHGFAVEVLDDPRTTGRGDGFANVLMRASRPEAAAAGAIALR
jgi:predicted TPR repeat methyltransferase